MTRPAEDLRRVVIDLLATLVKGRPVIMTGSAANSRGMARFLKEVGSARVSSVSLDGAPRGVRVRFAYYEAALAAPDQAFRGQLDALDPEQAAVVYAGSFTAVPEVAGRPAIGSRAAEHLAAERKDRQGMFTGLAGTVQPVDHGLSRLRRPTVVQGVLADGIAMAASHTYVLPPQAENRDLADLATHLGRDCDQLVARQFDVGTPCTFYGFVTPRWCVDFGPVEALVYWQRISWQVEAPGIVWPLALAPSQVQAAQQAVHETAQRLHEQTGYVGAYGTDGVVRDGRYLIHEINPRVCAGFSLLDKLLSEGPPLAAVDLVLRELGGAAADALQEPLAAAAAGIRHDPVVRGLLFDSGHVLTGSAVAELHRRPPSNSTRVHISDLEEEWST